jgi:hypothetical protein
MKNRAVWKCREVLKEETPLVFNSFSKYQLLQLTKCKVWPPMKQLCVRRKSHYCQLGQDTAAVQLDEVVPVCS